MINHPDLPLSARSVLRAACRLGLSKAAPGRVRLRAPGVAGVAVQHLQPLDDLVDGRATTWLRPMPASRPAGMTPIVASHVGAR
jgi:hypothetical protein